ncbi:MAG: Gfo/Idh/MocA family oxidoreductase [Paracoccaceae bacterium]|nr:Gfo/Idh/MocA family oxidoreductase [Paracoccaceae bacterium]MDE2917312.1 Gfo/Idh/MocA family oxidoreductase [Paracoccaceae bacterium]
MSETLRMAIAGIGLAGRRHADAIDQLPGISLCAVVEPDEIGQNYATNLNIPCHDTLDELFAEHSPDGVILATPTTLHVTQGLECIRQGCPVLVEKPLGTTSKECIRLVSEAERNGVVLMVGHHRRFNPLIRRAKEVISAGELGNIRAVHINTWFYKPDEYFEKAPWRKKFGAGPISVNLAHDIDLIRYLCGEVEAVQGHSVRSARGYENEDVAAAVLQFSNGAIGTITVSDSIVAPWSWELTSGEYPIYPPTSESCYWIGGSHGSLSLPDLRLWTHREGLRDWWTPISATSLTRGSSDPLVNQISHFADVIRGKSKPLVPGSEGLQSLKVIEAIQAACHKGIMISIDD